MRKPDLDAENGPEKVVWAASPEWIINDLPNVGIHPDRLYRPVPLPGINYLPYTDSVLVVDPAGTGTDETAWAVVKTLNVQKERRICDTLEPVIQSHRLVVNAALIQKDFASTQAYSFEHHQRYQLFFQMTGITRDRGALAKDDRGQPVVKLPRVVAPRISHGIEAEKRGVLD